MMQEKVEITNILAIGDSLSDRGTMAKSALAAFSGLWGTSPHGRFTNGFVWLDYFVRRLRADTDVTAIAPTPSAPKSFFSFNNDEYVGTQKSPILARTYCVGGMTAHDYSDTYRPRKPLLNASAKVLETLKSLREEVGRDDDAMALTEGEKASTLVVEWSGANDLITINNKPSMVAAEKAVVARAMSIRKMIDSGYKNFVLFNMPNLALTPRFQNGNADLRELADECCNHMNSKLEEAIDVLKRDFPDCSFHIFDANHHFVNAYSNPESFGFEKALRHQPFIESRAFKDDDPTTTAASYIFWDDVHPTEAVHVILANVFYRDVFSQHYNFAPSEHTLVRQFQKA